MKVAVIGSRGVEVPVAPYIPKECTAIISGGARGVDRCAMRYARSKGLEFVEIKPDYRRHGRGAPLRRNNKIVDMADMVVAVWDGKSKGTKYVIEQCSKTGKECRIIYA
jgi:hypothetical protein